mgnify:CR=1 FL=1
MKTFLCGILIGVCKILPGVSGALIAISLGIYEKAIDALANYFNNWKENTKFLLNLSLGIILSITLLSKLILTLMTKYYLLSITFFLMLIIIETIKYSKTIKYNKKNIIIIITSLIIFFLITKIKFRITLNSNLIMYFISGIIEIFSSLIPGISGTSLLISIGMYDKVLSLISNIYNYNYIILNLKYYLSYTIGMISSFILNVTLINYLYKKKRNILEPIILSLSIGSIILIINLMF